MKRVAGFALVGLGAAVSSMLASYCINSAATPHARAFLAEVVERRFSEEDGPGEGDVFYSVYARRSDGSEAIVSVTRAPGGDSANSAEIRDIRSRTRVALEPFTQSKTSYRLSPAELQGLEQPRRVCSSSPNPERSRILGYDIVRVRQEVVSPDGTKETFDSWLAPALNCYALRASAAFWDPSSGFQHGPHNETEVTVVIEGIPQEAVFDIPRSYVERSPSQVNEEYLKRFPGNPLFPMGAKPFDDAYYAQHRN